jgi:hypothetical protein
MQTNNKILITTLALCLISSKAFCLPLFNQKKIEAQQKKPIQNETPVEKTDPTSLGSTAVLQGLNKVTGKTSELRIKIGGEMDFGQINVKVRKCWKSPPDQRPENKILLEIEESETEKTPVGEVAKEANGNKKVIFYGWMFSSSPSISGLEHPIYDITAIECKN